MLCIVRGESLKVGRACLKREPLNFGIPLYLPRWAMYHEWLFILITTAIVPRMYKLRSAVYRVGVHHTGYPPACWRACGELGKLGIKPSAVAMSCLLHSTAVLASVVLTLIALWSSLVSRLSGT
ncbi:hypothetical protein DE146DRAFT_414518 [Phaeosphaeria sp. MPI-PUGE-AT-0046c]|nr:hypothetical protein DE146DRAFT_414518 [Phaeosphaeria sp. MPI-PUGE-AT-0046c]